MLPPDYESEFLMTDTSHKAASHNLREIASWLPGKGSADSDLLPELAMEETSEIDCLAEYLDCTVQELLDKIEEFKEEGCKLFDGK